MYIPDGSTKPYIGSTAQNEFYMYGWLDSEYEYTKGWASQEDKQEFLKRLEKIEPTHLCKGFHIDEGLGLAPSKHCTNGERLFLHNGIMYNAPSAATFYIKELDYCPPRIVIDSLLSFTLEECASMGNTIKEFEIKNFKWYPSILEGRDEQFVKCKCGAVYKSIVRWTHSFHKISFKNCSSCNSNSNIEKTSYYSI